MKLNFKGKYFDNREDAVHIDDGYVDGMINCVMDSLLNSDEDFDFSMSSTGDTMVFGVKIDEEEIDIYVAQDYSEACLLRNEFGEWEPLDWKRQEEYDEYDDMSKDELIEEIMRLKRAEYDPKREV